MTPRGRRRRRPPRGRPGQRAAMQRAIEATEPERKRKRERAIMRKAFPARGSRTATPDGSTNRPRGGMCRLRGTAQGKRRGRPARVSCSARTRCGSSRQVFRLEALPAEPATDAARCRSFRGGPARLPTTPGKEPPEGEPRKGTPGSWQLRGELWQWAYEPSAWPLTAARPRELHLVGGDHHRGATPLPFSPGVAWPRPRAPSSVSRATVAPTPGRCNHAASKGCWSAFPFPTSGYPVPQARRDRETAIAAAAGFVGGPAGPRSAKVSRMQTFKTAKDIKVGVIGYGRRLQHGRRSTCRR